MKGEVVYGRNSVRELIAAGRRPVHDIWSLPSLVREPWLADQPVSERSRAEIGGAAGSGSHQGIVAFTDSYPYASSADILVGDGPVVAIDGAEDPRNLGAIARVAGGRRSLRSPLRPRRAPWSTWPSLGWGACSLR